MVQHFHHGLAAGEQAGHGAGCTLTGGERSPPLGIQIHARYTPSQRINAARRLLLFQELLALVGEGLTLASSGRCSALCANPSTRRRLTVPVLAQELRDLSFSVVVRAPTVSWAVRDQRSTGVHSATNLGEVRAQTPAAGPFSTDEDGVLAGVHAGISQRPKVPGIPRCRGARAATSDELVGEVRFLLVLCYERSITAELYPSGFRLGLWALGRHLRSGGAKSLGDPPLELRAVPFPRRVQAGPVEGRPGFEPIA